MSLDFTACRRTARGRTHMRSGARASGARTPTPQRKCHARPCGVLSDGLLAPFHNVAPAHRRCIQMARMLDSVARLCSVVEHRRHALIGSKQHTRGSLGLASAGSAWCGSASSSGARHRPPCSPLTPSSGSRRSLTDMLSTSSGVSWSGKHAHHAIRLCHPDTGAAAAGAAWQEDGRRAADRKMTTGPTSRWGPCAPSWPASLGARRWMRCCAAEQTAQGGTGGRHSAFSDAVHSSCRVVDSTVLSAISSCCCG